MDAISCISVGAAIIYAPINTGAFSSRTGGDKAATSLQEPNELARRITPPQKFGWEIALQKKEYYDVGKSSYNRSRTLRFDIGGP